MATGAYAKPQLADRSLSEHQEVKNILHELETMPPDHPKWVTALALASYFLSLGRRSCASPDLTIESGHASYAAETERKGPRASRRGRALLLPAVCPANHCPAHPHAQAQTHHNYSTSTQ